MRLPTTAALRMLSGTAIALAVSAALAMPAAAARCEGRPQALSRF